MKQKDVGILRYCLYVKKVSSTGLKPEEKL